MGQLAAHSPHLKHLLITISRTRGDNHEVGIYRTLSKLPSLEHASLRLMYSIGPDIEFWDEEQNGTHPLSGCGPEEIPLADLKEAFSNSAVDETLARAIFQLVS